MALLQVSVNDAVRRVLSSAQECEALSADDKQAAQQACTAATVDWKLLRRVCSQLREAQHGGPWLHELCSGSQIMFSGPRERKKSPELQTRLQKLQDQVDQQRYDSMVADVTKKERQAAATRNSTLPTFRLQASFGLHVLTTMGTLFAVGFYAGKVLFGSENTTLATMTGTLGMTGGMILETTLLIIRANRPGKQPSSLRRTYTTGRAAPKSTGPIATDKKRN